MYRFRGASQHAPGAAMAMMPRQITPMFKPNSGPPEEIVIEDDNDSPVVISQRRVVRPPAARGRGGRRGRPRLDPDTDLGKHLSTLVVVVRGRGLNQLTIFKF